MRNNIIVRLISVILMMLLAMPIVRASDGVKADAPSKLTNSYIAQFTVDGIGYGLTAQGDMWVVSFPTMQNADVDIPDEITIGGNTYPVVGIDNFTVKERINVLTIPRSIQQMYCTSQYGSSVNVLKWNAISCNAGNNLDNFRVKKLVIGEDVESILGFYYSVIDSLVFNAKNLKGNYQVHATEMRSIAIGDRVEYIPKYFASYSQITHIIVPKSVTKIGSNAFATCKSMVSATVQGPIDECASTSSIFWSFNGTLFLMEGTTSVTGFNSQPSAVFSLCETPPTADEYSFRVRDGVVVHVPSDAAITEYKSAPNWHGFDYRADAVRPETFSIPADQQAFVNTSFSITSSLGPWTEGMPVAWVSTDKQVAAVDSTGMVTVLAKGEVDIIAICYDHVATCHLTAIDNILKITPETITVVEGMTATLTVSCGEPLDGLDLQWSSDDQSVATIVGDGTTATLSGIARGKTVVHVKSASGDFVDASCQVEVNRPSKNSYARGDVNGDGVVDVGDISDEIDVILGNESPDDLRGDCALLLPRDVVDVSDLNELVNIVLGKGEPTLTETIGANGVAFKMVFVPGGSFIMGATEEQLPYITFIQNNSDETPAHQVTLSDYWIGETEVTQELWEAVMGENPSTVIGANLPVNNISRDDCLKFIKRLNEITGMTFCLPTEAQWEYAARGGQRSRGFVYAGSNNADDVAWYKDNSDGQPHMVATKAPNELGLYDMSGNVFEWCSDCYCYWYYSISPEKDPELTHSFDDDPWYGEYTYRGGSFRYESNYDRVSARNNSYWSDGYDVLGLRLARKL